MAELVTYCLDDGIAEITLDDGKANAMSPAMMAGINAALDRAIAARAAALDRAVLAASKQRIREQSARAVRAAIDADRAARHGRAA